MRTETFHVPGPVRLRLRIPAGEIHVESGDSPETVVELDADDDDVLEAARIEARGSELTVSLDEARRLFLRRAHDVRLRVRCPHGTNLDVQAVSAEIRAQGRFGTADVKTVSGNVRVDEAADGLDLKTISGDALVQRSGGPLRVKSVSGDVTVDDCGASVEARTVSGDLRVGSVREGTVSAQSVSGDVGIGIARGSRIWIDAKSVSGDLDSELEVSDTPASSEGPLVEIRANTLSGDLRIFRA